MREEFNASRFSAPAKLDARSRPFTEFSHFLSHDIEYILRVATFLQPKTPRRYDLTPDLAPIIQEKVI